VKNLLEPLLTRQQVAEYLGIDIRSVDGIVTRGELKTVKVGSRFVRIPAASVEAYVSKGGAK
jgi:excisionase family DNA binding protein